MRNHLWLILFTAACATNPSPGPDATNEVVRAASAPGEQIDLTRHTLIHSQEFPASRTEVWTALLALAGDLGMAVQSADPGAGMVIYHVHALTPRVAGRPASAWLDCGRAPGGAPRVNTYHVTIRLTAVVEPSTGEMRVRTALVGYARDRGVAGDGLPCTSTDRLEWRALALLAARLAR